MSTAPESPSSGPAGPPNTSSDPQPSTSEGGATVPRIDHRAYWSQLFENEPSTRTESQTILMARWDRDHPSASEAQKRTARQSLDVIRKADIGPPSVSSAPDILRGIGTAFRETLAVVFVAIRSNPTFRRVLVVIAFIAILKLMAVLRVNLQLLGAGAFVFFAIMLGQWVYERIVTPGGKKPISVWLIEYVFAILVSAVAIFLVSGAFFGVPVDLRS